MDNSPEELISKLEDMVECAICLEQFKDPRSLPCQHSFCRHCLEGMLGPERKIRCPCCNKETSVSKDVRELPVDFRANSWLEIMSEYQKAKTAREAEAAQAEMTHPAQQEAPEVISRSEPCPICEQVTTDPKNLSCGHHLCANCVQFLLPVGGDTLHCPTCSSETVILPTPNNPPSTSITSQPDNPSDNEPLYQTLFELLGGRPPTVGGRSQRAQPSAPPDVFSNGPRPVFPSIPSGNTSAVNKLKFHPRCGKNAIVLPDQLMAYRKNPDVWGEAIVLTAQHLKPDQMFEIRLDKKETQWSGSLQIGVTTHSPIEPGFPSALYQLTSGTWYMTGRRVRHNNLTTNEEYGQDLNYVQAGDRIGVQRKSDGTLHFYINGVDQGVAASFVPAAVYGVVDIFGKAEHVTILQNHVGTASTMTPPSVTPTARSLYPDMMAMAVTASPVSGTSQNVSVTPQQVSVTPQPVPVTSSQASIPPQQAPVIQQSTSVAPQQVSVIPQQTPTTPQNASSNLASVGPQVPVTPQPVSVSPQESSVTPLEGVSATPQQVSVTPQQAVEGMTMSQMLSMLELLTKAVGESREENVAEAEYSSIAHNPRSTALPSTPGPRVPSRPAPVVPPKSSQPERQTPPPVPTTPRPSGLKKERPQERPPSPPTSARPSPLSLGPPGVPTTPPSPGSPYPPTQVSSRGTPPPPPARTRPVFPPSTDETSTPPAPVRSTSIPQADTSPTGDRRSQDRSTSASSKVPKQGLKVSLTDVLNKKSGLKKAVKQ